MATTHNITITYFNGTDYDTLYPQIQPSNILQGTLASQILASATSVSNLSNTQIRNIYCGTTDMTAGTSVLSAGDIYLCYE